MPKGDSNPMRTTLGVAALQRFSGVAHGAGLLRRDPPASGSLCTDVPRPGTTDLRRKWLRLVLISRRCAPGARTRAGPASRSRPPARRPGTRARRTGRTAEPRIGPNHRHARLGRGRAAAKRASDRYGRSWRARPADRDNAATPGLVVVPRHTPRRSRLMSAREMRARDERIDLQQCSRATVSHRNAAQQPRAARRLRLPTPWQWRCGAW